MRLSFLANPGHDLLTRHEERQGGSGLDSALRGTTKGFDRLGTPGYKKQEIWLSRFVAWGEGKSSSIAGREE